MSKLLLVFGLFFLIIVTSFALADTCYTSVANIPVVCTGGSITQDMLSGSCRTILCSSNNDSLQVQACDKPTSTSPDHFEMYNQGQVGTIVSKICLDNACISNNGFASQNFPVCSGNIVPPVNNNTNQGSAILSVAPWYPKGNNYILLCNANGFTPTSYDFTFGDGHMQIGMSNNNVYHTYNNGSYDATCIAKSSTQQGTGKLHINVGTSIPPINSTGNQTNQTTTNQTNNTGSCFSSVQYLPATCTGGTITRDDFNRAGDSCRYISCSNQKLDSVNVQACDRPNPSNAQYFEMYRQSYTGTPPQVCLGNDCLKSGWGYQKGSNFPICMKNTTTQPAITLTPISEYSQDLAAVFLCNATGNVTSYSFLYGDNTSEVRLTNISYYFSTPPMNINPVNTMYAYHLYALGGNYSITCIAQYANNISVKAMTTVSVHNPMAPGVIAQQLTSQEYQFTCHLANYPPENVAEWSIDSNSVYNFGQIMTVNLTPGTHSVSCDFQINNAFKMPGFYDKCGPSGCGDISRICYPHCLGTFVPPATVTIANQTNTTNHTNTTNQTNTTTCVSSVQYLPATCSGGAITSNTFNGCRQITCSNGSSNMQVMACDKPNVGTRTYFEMYKQGQTGTDVSSICIGTTCISNNGYALSSAYPICVNVSGSEIGPSSGAQENLNTYTPPGIPFSASPSIKSAAASTPLIGNLDFDAYQINNEVIKAQIYYNFTTALTADHTVKFTWKNLDTNNSGSPPTLVIPVGTVGEYGIFATIGKKPYGAGEIDQPGHYEATFQLQGATFNATRTLGFTATGTQPVCPWCSPSPVPVAPSASVHLSVSPFFPADYNVAFTCNASNFTPTKYTFDFGDGQTETRPVYDIYHTYDANGTYTVKCTASDGTNNATDTIAVPVTMPFSPSPLSRYTMTVQLTAKVLHDRTLNMTCQPVGFRRANTVDQWQFFGDGPNQGYTHPGAINTDGSGSFGLNGIQFQVNTPLSIVNSFPTAGNYFSLCSVIYYDPQYHPDYYDYTSSTYHNISCSYGCQMAVSSIHFSIPTYNTTYADGDACVHSNTTSDFICTGTKETCKFDSVEQNGQTVGYWGTNKSRVCHEGYWFPIRYWS